MRAPFFIAVTWVVLVAIGGLTSGSLDDRATLVPPPDAVAENFVRMVETERFSQATRFLAEENAASEEDLKHLYARIEQRLGRVTEIESEVRQQDDEHATAEVTISSARGETTLQIDLAWSNAEWKITSSPAEWAP
ncbi:MAG TPA: hypothetical protein VFL80_02430 [Thermoanaerobaculia bacterium]|nr:hypothetical protein [Thermoanaerobaculia bacterium]